MEIGSTGRGVLRLGLYAIVTVLGIPLQVLFLRFGGPYARLPVAYHRLCCRILGLRVVMKGRPVRDRATLFISNHSSYLDIPVLGSLLPTSFVAKTEVGGWPVFGLLARLQRTVFVDRTARHRADEQRDSIAGRLQAGDNLVLFPEGTSSDGNRTLPFKTALFAVAATPVDGKPLTLQPVSVTATHLDDLPLGHAWRALYAWYGDMELPPHLWQMVRLGGRLRVLVEFHQPVSLADFSSRKALAEHCWRTVATGVERAVKGRDEPAAQNDVATPAALPAAG